MKAKPFWKLVFKNRVGVPDDVLTEEEARRLESSMPAASPQSEPPHKPRRGDVLFWCVLALLSLGLIYGASRTVFRLAHKAGYQAAIREYLLNQKRIQPDDFLEYIYHTNPTRCYDAEESK